MGWETTRIVRLYPKNSSKQFDIASFCKHIASTSKGLSSHVLWINNKLENCFDIKFESSKSSGALAFNFKTVDVWELSSFDDGETSICFHNEHLINKADLLFSKVLFGFDTIKLKGTSEGINVFFDVVGLNRKQSQESIPIKGKYYGNNHYQTIPVGNFPEKQVAQIKKTEFLKLRGDNCFIENFDRSDEPGFNLNNLLEFVNGDIFENYFIGLDSIEFYYHARCVRQITWIPNKGYEKGMWLHKSSDWWDNCLNDNWMKYQKIKTI